MEITIHEEKISHFTFHGKKKGRSRVTKIPFTTLVRDSIRSREQTTISPPKSLATVVVDRGLGTNERRLAIFDEVSCFWAILCLVNECRADSSIVFNGTFMSFASNYFR